MEERAQTEDAFYRMNPDAQFRLRIKSAPKPLAAHPDWRDRHTAATDMSVPPALARQLSDEGKNLLVTALTQPPNAFLCPITLDLMTDPVSAEDGHTYERSAIEEWVREGRGRSPVTNQSMGRDLRANHAIRSAIDEWLQTHGAAAGKLGY